MRMDNLIPVLRRVSTSDLQERISAVVSALDDADRPLSMKQLAEWMGVSEPTARKYLDPAVASGQIRRIQLASAKLHMPEGPKADLLEALLNGDSEALHQAIDKTQAQVEMKVDQ